MRNRRAGLKAKGDGVVGGIRAIASRYDLGQWLRRSVRQSSEYRSVRQSLESRSVRKYSSAEVSGSTQAPKCPEVLERRYRTTSFCDAVRRRESKGGGDGAYGAAASIEEVATAAALGLGPGGVVQVHHVAAGAAFDVLQRHRIVTVVPCAFGVAAAAQAEALGIGQIARA